MEFNEYCADARQEAKKCFSQVEKELDEMKAVLVKMVSKIKDLESKKKRVYKKEGEK